MQPMKGPNVVVDFGLIRAAVDAYNDNGYNGPMRLRC